MATVTDKDIYDTANLLIQEYGDGAEFQATLRQRERRKSGDADGTAVWERVIKAIRALQADEPEDGERLN